MFFFLYSDVYMKYFKLEMMLVLMNTSWLLYILPVITFTITNTNHSYLKIVLNTYRIIVQNTLQSMSTIKCGFTQSQGTAHVYVKQENDWMGTGKKEVDSFTRFSMAGQVSFFWLDNSTLISYVLHNINFSGVKFVYCIPYQKGITFLSIFFLILTV